MAGFLFVLCQVGAEAALKREVLDGRPELRLAFSRPGFLTFKNTSTEPVRVDPLPSTFARLWGTSVGPFSSPEEIIGRAQELSHGKRPWRLHVFEREPARTCDLPPGPILGEAAIALNAKLKELARELQPPLFHPESPSVPGDMVLDVMLALRDPEAWLGFHRHVEGHVPYPGGRIPLELPERVPSRAFFKIEEARVLFDIPLRPGDQVVEIGCAPGGAVLALLRRGLTVLGIDPTEMDPIVHEFAKGRAGSFTHIREPVGQVRREDLPQRVDWLLVDMNLAPQVALHAVHRLADRLRSTLLGVVLTLKLNEWSFARQIPNFLRRIRAMGIADPRARQLPSNRQEICVYGLTARGAHRTGSAG